VGIRGKKSARENGLSIDDIPASKAPNPNSVVLSFLDDSTAICREKLQSIAHAQQVFPLAKVAFESHALSDLEIRDHTSLDLLAALSGTLAG
jgi:hypothetical protein